MRGNTSLLRGWRSDPRASWRSDPRASLHSDAVYMQRKRSERSCPLDLESLDSEFGLLNLKCLLGKGGTTDFQVRRWGIRRTRKSVVPFTVSRPNLATHDTRS